MNNIDNYVADNSPVVDKFMTKYNNYLIELFSLFFHQSSQLLISNNFHNTSMFSQIWLFSYFHIVCEAYMWKKAFV